MVVVMPGLPEREHGKPGDVGRLILDVKSATPEEMADRVHRPGDVVDEEDPHQPAPDVALQRSDEGEPGEDEPGHRGNPEGDQHQPREATPDPAHLRVLVELSGVLLPVGLTLRLEQPTGMGMP